ncbi:E3 SUMO-protein ligase NSE2-like [Babylonia areolata]|uniref:E3 SUMO-protein ligase NSE2-like n=1 Tax=Babylonia areolata TaxID=304850 RepID=UPI003FD1708B
MPRGAGASSSGSFRGAEQSLHIMRQVKSYFNVGMDHVLEVSADMAEHGKGDEGQAKQLRTIMLSYLQMERDMNNFMTAASNVMEEGADCEEEGALVRMLQSEVAELSNNNDDEALKEHDKYQELLQKIWDSQNPDTVPTTLGAGGTAAATSAAASGSREGVEEEEEVEMTQQQVNTRCPYTGKEMVDPVRNIICRHTYDRAGIQQHIKQRGKKAMCPVGGCTNNKPITSRDLEEHKEMRRYIQNKKKRHGQPSASSSGTQA